MTGYTQAQIAKKYNVSRATVGRWVELTREGKYNLQLDLSNNKVRILDNAHNEAVLLNLVSTASKYQVTNQVKEVQISKAFYTKFSEEELAELFTDLKYYNKINLKYTYKSIGAKYWDMFHLSGVSKITPAIDEMMDFGREEIIYYLDKTKKKVNLIDIGPGNAYPIKNTLKNLLKNSLISKYIGIDISDEINKIAEKNIRNWFPSLETSYYERDLEDSRIANIVLGGKNSEENNLILYIGNTIGNHEDRIEILKHLKSGMTPEDLLIVTFTLDVPANRAVLNYVKNKESDLHQGWIPEFFGIDSKLCEVVVEYNAKLNCKTKGFKLDKDYDIEFKLPNRTEMISLKKDQIINTWKHYLVDTIKFIEEARQAGLEVINFKTNENGTNAMAICRVKL